MASAPTFTTTGDRDFEARIAAQLDEVVASLEAAPIAAASDCLVLGGGYGRGEGGAREGGGRLEPYNDYDLVLVHHGAAAAAAAWARQADRECSASFGCRVEVHPIRRERILDPPPTLTWYELGRGHRLLWGSADPLAGIRRLRLADVPRHEWGRLLVNRAAGVHFARRVLVGRPPAICGDEAPRAFCARQAAKAWLALGDVRLVREGAYDPSVRRRLERWRARARPAWGHRYEEAVAFKLRPCDPPFAETAWRVRELAPLLRAELSRHRAAGRGRENLVGLAHAMRLPWRSALIGPWRYPRERLRHALRHAFAGDRWRFRLAVVDDPGFEATWERFA